MCSPDELNINGHSVEEPNERSKGTTGKHAGETGASGGLRRQVEEGQSSERGGQTEASSTGSVDTGKPATIQEVGDSESAEHGNWDSLQPIEGMIRKVDGELAVLDESFSELFGKLQGVLYAEKFKENLYKTLYPGYLELHKLFCRLSRIYFQVKDSRDRQERDVLSLFPQALERLKSVVGDDEGWGNLRIVLDGMSYEADRIVSQRILPQCTPLSELKARTKDLIGNLRSVVQSDKSDIGVEGSDHYDSGSLLQDGSAFNVIEQGTSTLSAGSEPVSKSIGQLDKEEHNGLSPVALERIAKAVASFDGLQEIVQNLKKSLKDSEGNSVKQFIAQAMYAGLHRASRPHIEAIEGFLGQWQHIFDTFQPELAPESESINVFLALYSQVPVDALSNMIDDEGVKGVVDSVDGVISLYERISPVLEQARFEFERLQQKGKQQSSVSGQIETEESGQQKPSRQSSPTGQDQ